jgi:hypothetical protein
MMGLWSRRERLDEGSGFGGSGDAVAAVMSWRDEAFPPVAVVRRALKRARIGGLVLEVPGGDWISQRRS